MFTVIMLKPIHETRDIILLKCHQREVLFRGWMDNGLTSSYIFIGVKHEHKKRLIVSPAKVKSPSD